MKRILFFLALVCLGKVLHAQQPYIYTIKADSVKITNTCDTAELIIENHTQNVPGFLFNKGKGRTEFRRVVKLNDSTLVLGRDTIVIQGSVSASNGLHIANRQVKLGGPLNQTVTTISGNGNKMVVFDSLSLFAVNGDAMITKLAVNTYPGDLGTAIFGARANNSNNAFFRFYNTRGSTKFALDLVNDEGRFDMLNDNGIASIRLQPNDISFFNGRNVGIGTTLPGDKLHVSGTVRIKDTLKMPSIIVKSDTSSYKPVIIDNNGNVFKMNGWPATTTPALAVVGGGTSDITVAVGTLTKLPDLAGAGSHSVSLPAAANYAGQKIYIWNRNSSSNSWTFSSSVTLPDGSTSNSIPNESTIELLSDGSVWIKWK